jgi:hypothetical protein
VLAAEAGVDGILLSNHGGNYNQSFYTSRVLNCHFQVVSLTGMSQIYFFRFRIPKYCSALPPMEVLYKLRQQRPDVFHKVEGKFYAPIVICRSH